MLNKIHFLICIIFTSRKSTRAQFIASLCLAFALTLFSQPVYARGEANTPPLDVFIEQVTNGQADILRGVYVSGVLASPVVLQPAATPAFVSSAENTLTQFELASRYGSVGLLAHNSLAGKNFSLLEQGQVLYLIYGDGAVMSFVITDLLRFQALDPENVHSHFVDLATDDVLTAPELFLKIYDQPGKVILQTCITAYGNNSWGRLFISAEPYMDHSYGSAFGFTAFH